MVDRAAYVLFVPVNDKHIEMETGGSSVYSSWSLITSVIDINYNLPFSISYQLSFI